MIGFWIFMLVMTWLVPLTMIVFGLVFYYKPPKKINSVYGYRTKRSCKNQKTWDFAHRYCGKLWTLFGTAIIPFSVLPMILVWGEDADTAGIWGGTLVMIQCLLLVLTIPLTERALRKNFDAYGMKKEQ